MNTYLIMFKTNSEARKAQIVARIKSYGGWLYYFECAILVRTNHNAEVLQNDLLAHVTQSESFFIAPFRRPEVRGLMPQEVWNWINALP